MKNLLTKKTPLAMLLTLAVLSQYGCGEDKKAAETTAPAAATAEAASGTIVITEADYLKAAKEIVDYEQGNIKYPANNQLYGDWKQGKFWAEDTHGGRIGFADFDDPKHLNGANCYACHAIDPGFLGAGNMGPSLTDYGMRGKSVEMIKYTYDKIYSAKATNPCSLMPRFGGKGHLLTPEQIADITAFLLDAESPVNKHN